MSTVTFTRIHDFISAWRKYLDPALWERLALDAWAWTLAHVLTLEAAVQALLILVAFLVARLLAPHMEKLVQAALGHRRFPSFLVRPVRALGALSLPVLWLALQWFTVFAAAGAGYPNRLIESVVSLLTAWVVIRYASGFVRDSGFAKLLAIAAWSVAALNLVGLLDPTIQTLDSMAFSLGDIRLSVLGILKAALVLMIMLWLAGVISRLIEHRLDVARALSPSARVLIGKLVRVLLIIIAVITALESIGIDLTALAVLGGAIGLGIGFGLQKVISNLMSWYYLAHG